LLPGSRSVAAGAGTGGSGSERALRFDSESRAARAEIANHTALCEWHACCDVAAKTMPTQQKTARSINREPARAPVPTDTFRFGDFELHGRLFELRRRGERLAVQPKVLELLFYLVNHRDRTVPNDELRQALWPTETVGTSSLRRAIRVVRGLLGDSGNSQSSIRTIRSYGYRFVMTVELVAPIIEQAPAGARHVLPGRPRAFTGSLRRLPRRRPRMWAAYPPLRQS
jgi:DNA-binding winged helix-turn-helix (wHTH) protein